jgi:hypothetical protein
VRKVFRDPIEDVPPAPRRGGMARLIVLCLLASPVVFDGARLCFAGWQGLFGTVSPVETPVFDMLTSSWRSLIAAVDTAGSSGFRSISLAPGLVLPVALVWGLGCGWWLRRA